MLFKNRQEAGKKLADKLLPYKEDEPLVLALPRGGVAIGYEVAQALEAPLDTLVVRKIGAPGELEYGIGAIAPGDVLVLSEKAIQDFGFEQADIDPIIAKEFEEMDRRVARYGSGEYSKDWSGETVIIVDDGLATGVTAKAAIESAKLSFGEVGILLAVPVCAKATAETMRREVGAALVCLEEREDFGSVGEWYEEFDQVSDEEVTELLKKAEMSQ